MGRHLESNTIQVRDWMSDADGQPIFKTSAAASPVNEITITNAATGAAPSLAATGADTNVDLKLIGKGTGSVSLGLVQFVHAGSGTPAKAASAVIAGVGTSAAPCASSTADDKFLEFRCKTTATSGDNRLGYFRFEVGAAGGGECIRAFTALTAASSTVRGSHISLVPSGTGAVSGLGTAGSYTLHFGTAAFSTGNVACIEAQPYADSTNAPPTEHGAVRIAGEGNATGIALFKNAIHVAPAAEQVGNKAAQLMVCNADVTGGGGAAAGGIQVRVNGTQYWIPLYTL